MGYSLHRIHVELDDLYISIYRTNSWFFYLPIFILPIYPSLILSTCRIGRSAINCTLTIEF